MDVTYDCVVVGAGIEGSATAYQISREGKRVLLLEQFPLLHNKGSSHGGSRIIRKAYQQDCFAVMTAEAYEEWSVVEQLTGETIFVKTGVVYFGENGSTEVGKVIENLQKHNAEFRTLDHSELLLAIPNSVYSSDYSGVYDESGGILLADKALSCLQELVVKYGGEIKDNCRVTDIQPGDILTLETTKGQIRSRTVALCPGSWAGELTTKLGLKLPIQPIRCFVLYWREKDANSPHSVASGMPCFIDCYNEIYAIPSLEKPGYMKLCCHGGYNFGIENPDVHEDKPPYNLDYACQYVKEHFPGLHPFPEIVEKCKYSDTPDEICILDTHPLHSNIAFAEGFSGTGFKIAPVVGNIIRDLLLKNPPKFDLTPFSMKRFL